MEFLRKLSISTVTKTTMAALASAALITLPITSFAQTGGQTSQGSDQPSTMGGQGGQPQTLENVEELLDNVERYDGQKVSVSGEVEEKIDKKAFILESGGLFNDEMVVLVPKGNLMVKEDDKVTVTGTVRAVKFVDIERDYDWDLDPEIKIEIEDVDAFLIADRVEITEKDD